MKFQQTITNKSETPYGLSTAVLTFEASSWEAAGRTGDRLQRDLGMDGPSYSSIIVYAPKHTNPAPLSELLAEDEERARFDRENPHPHVPGQRYLSNNGGHQ